MNSPSTSAQQFEAEVSEQGKIVDFLTGQLLEPKPEEWVRQRFLRILHYEYGYAKNVMVREVPIWYGSKELVDQVGAPVRADIVVYDSASACTARDQGRVSLVVECKAPTETQGYNQLVSYIFNTSAAGGVWFNGSGKEDEIEYYRRVVPDNKLLPWIGIPRPDESWDALGRRRKSDLRRPKDIKGLLRRCHNRLHGRGTEGEEEDLTMDMVRIILAKAMDEEKESELPDFYCTPEEYGSAAGQASVARRVSILFDEVKALNAQVFTAGERISVGERAVCDVVVELQGFQLLVDLAESRDWDIMGHAYEEYTATYLKRKHGQYFTNRFVVDFLVGLTDPTPTDLVLDPAGGSGGFLTGTLRYVRQKVLQGQGSDISKQRQLDRFRTRLFMVEISKRLVKIAKTAMILNGDGHTGMTAGDSLGSFANFDDTVVAQAGCGTPTVILTNPPFAGVGEGRITDKEVLERFQTGKRWNEVNGSYSPSTELQSDGVPPELLFFERCIEWLAPGGTLGIVLPKSFLDTQTYLPGRHLLFSQCHLLAVVNCHKNTFQPHTGVRTSLLLIRKLHKDEEMPHDYPIFMAISKKIGQDSEGIPIFKRDANDNLLDEPDHDLDEIAAAFHHFKQGDLQASEYTFSVQRSELNGQLRINPQAFLPSLNSTLQKVAAMDGVRGWTVTTLGQVSQDVKIFKGPRFSSERLNVEGPGEDYEPYYTPSAILQEKADSVKWLDLSKASKMQKRTIEAIRVRDGDIVVTRSGSIGRVAYITKHLHNAIASDDLIRVRVAEDTLRHYIFSFLHSRFAQDQMLRNEYGAIQQHLEPEHLRDILIPIPDDWAQAQEAIDSAAQIIQLKAQLQEAQAKTLDVMSATLQELVEAASAQGQVEDI
jgi:type I restriction-modification system DNA methylase subunit